eukprot:m.62791 g.62791  ORF g.62791 m.62791 type:complete len:395 (+) comp19401_c0_seq2:130-1314(+)
MSGPPDTENPDLLSPLSTHSRRISLSNPGTKHGLLGRDDLDSPTSSKYARTGASIGTLLFLPASFFADAAEECENKIEAPVLRDAHLTLPGSEKAATEVSKYWRRTLTSPLGTFLTGVRNKYAWVQLAGHKGNFVPGQAGTLCKRGSDLERAALEALMHDVLKPFVPLFYKEVEIPEEKAFYLEMEDLLHGFGDASVMDIKMGVRTFLETEVKKKQPRKDLLAKMVALDPDEPTEEEKENGITKLRYMLFRERLSSTTSLGFRIEGTKLAGLEPRNDFKTVQTKEQVLTALTESFMPSKEEKLYERVRQQFHSRLMELQDALQVSPFFSTHEIVGSSLLFIYDSSGKAGVWMIDFGKTSKVDHPLTHSVPWKLGNREDGYLIGLENLISIFADC